MIHEYETVVREFILNSQIPIIILHENHHLYHTDLEPQLDACRPSQKKSFFKRAKCLSNSAFRSDREASTALASLKKMGGGQSWDGWKYTQKYTPRNISGLLQGYFYRGSRFGGIAKSSFQYHSWGQNNIYCIMFF